MRKGWTSLNFSVYARPFVHCLLVSITHVNCLCVRFPVSRKFDVRTSVNKIETIYGKLNISKRK